MKTKILWIGAVVLLALTSAWAADVAGKWIAQMPGRNGTTETTFNFKVEGTKLTGSMTNPQGETEITDGKIEGDNISFAVIRRMGENEMKILYKGKVSGDEIKFTREFQGGMMGGPGGGGPPGGRAGGPGGASPEIVAKRVK